MMKQNILLLLLLQFSSKIGYAQDTIKYSDYTQSIVYIDSIANSKIYFRPIENPQHIIQNIDLGQVKSIQYFNHRKQIFITPKNNYDSMYAEGVNDAKINFKPKKIQNINIISTAILSPAYGLIVTLPMNFIPPTYNNMNISAPYSFNSSDAYKKGYKNEAKKMKSSAVWKGFWKGSIVFGILWAIIGIAVFISVKK